MLDVLQQALTPLSIVLSPNKKDLSPVGGRILRQQESLVVDQRMHARKARPRLTFQETDRKPETQGLAGPLYLTARCRSPRLLLFASVACHLSLALC